MQNKNRGDEVRLHMGLVNTWENGLYERTFFYCVMQSNYCQARHSISHMICMQDIISGASVVCARRVFLLHIVMTPAMRMVPHKCVIVIIINNNYNNNAQVFHSLYVASLTTLSHHC